MSSILNEAYRDGVNQHSSRTAGEAEARTKQNAPRDYARETQDDYNNREAARRAEEQRQADKTRSGH